MNEDRYLTVREVALHFRVSCETVRKWIRDKKLPALDLGTGKQPTYRILESSLGTLGTVNCRPKSTNPALIGVEEFI